MLNSIPFQRPSASEALESEFINSKMSYRVNKDNSFMINFEMVPSSKQLEESLDWSVTQSYIGKKHDRPEC